MAKFVALVAWVSLLVPIAARAETATTPKIAEGRMIYGVDGQRLAPVYRVNVDGSVQLIMEGRLLTISPAMLSDVGGKLVSSQSENDLQR